MFNLFTKNLQYKNLKSIKNISEKKLLRAKKYNQKFIKKKLIEYKDYFDHIYDDINPNVVLDENQRIAILTDEDYNLIIAGAGSGKTTTMIGKIKYLVEKCNVNPKEILAISFAKKNVIELDEKLNKQLKLNIDVKTFHSLGLNIIKENSSKKSIISNDKMYEIIKSYFKHEIFKDKINLKATVNFLNLEFEIGSNMENFDNLEDYFKYANKSLKMSLKNKYEKYNDKILSKVANRKTLKNEYVRSNEELKIANFLFSNGIDYEYEKKYIYSQQSGILYHPDFTLYNGSEVIYLEHFGITENGTSDFYGSNELNKYINKIKTKVNIHNKFNTKLIMTFSKYTDGKSLFEHLEDLLTKNGFILKPKSSEELFEIIVSIDNENYFNNYIIKVMNFISKMKTNEIKVGDLVAKINKDNNKRTKLFVETVIPIYDYYQTILDSLNGIDFEDMIVLAKNIVNKDNFKLSKYYKYLIIDEYQDISIKRFELIQAIIKKFSANIIAVGDDWQAIFGFAGSDVSLFTKFTEFLGYGEILKITNTYRNSQELIDLAAEFVQKDNNNIKKHLTSHKHLNKPVVVYSYGSESYDRAKAILLAIYDITKDNNNSKVLLIARYQFDIDYLLTSGLFKRVGEYLKPANLDNIKLEYCTVHKSKGLEYDNVIIINAIDATYGFPSRVKNDPIYDIFGDNQDLNYAEERRLFYVALTRTKNKVYIVVPKENPSPFILEIKNNMHVLFKDDIIEDYEAFLELYRCPKCSNTLKKTKIDNLYVYRCISDNEICDFKTTELKYKYPLEHCPNCDGYLIYKTVINKKVLIGCTNYKVDELGCNYKIYIN